MVISHYLLPVTSWSVMWKTEVSGREMAKVLRAAWEANGLLINCHPSWNLDKLSGKWTEKAPKQSHLQREHAINIIVVQKPTTVHSFWVLLLKESTETPVMSYLGLAQHSAVSVLYWEWTKRRPSISLGAHKVTTTGRQRQAIAMVQCTRVRMLSRSTCNNLQPAFTNIQISAERLH